MWTPIPGVKVIGLGHKARNGKDTTGAVFQDFFGSQCRRYAFADALRVICRVDFGMTTKDANLLQQVGTEVYRLGGGFAIDGKVIRQPSTPDMDVWVRTVYWTIAEQAPLIAVVSDVRFPNEAQMVKDMGGTLIKCVRRCQNGRQFVDPSRDPKHASETALDDYNGWDYTIDAFNVAELEYQAIKICEDVAAEVGWYAKV